MLKRLLLLSTALTVQVLLTTAVVLVLVSPGAKANDPAPLPCNGDVNGDCTLNIADPVHLLSFLFVPGRKLRGWTGSAMLRVKYAWMAAAWEVEQLLRLGMIPGSPRE